MMLTCVVEIWTMGAAAPLLELIVAVRHRTSGRGGSTRTSRPPMAIGNLQSARPRSRRTKAPRRCWPCC